MLQVVECVNCNNEFQAEQWESGGSCPKCGKEFTWDSVVDIETGDEYYYPDW
jgi:Zn finger protein HypA/HybF involved in hydrogenase expression